MIWNRETETAPRAIMRALQGERLGRACAWAVERVPFYRKAFAARGVDVGTIKGVDDLRRLPFTVKADLRDHYPWGLFAVPQAELSRIHASSGTKGKPTVGGYPRGDLEVWGGGVGPAVRAGGA